MKLENLIKSLENGKQIIKQIRIVEHIQSSFFFKIKSYIKISNMREKEDLRLQLIKIGSNCKNYHTFYWDQQKIRIYSRHLIIRTLKGALKSSLYWEFFISRVCYTGPFCEGLLSKGKQVLLWHIENFYYQGCVLSSIYCPTNPIKPTPFWQ